MKKWKKYESSAIYKSEIDVISLCLIIRVNSIVEDE